MAFFYQVYGLFCSSEITIPAFYPLQEDQVTGVDFEVKLGKVPLHFEQEPQTVDEYSKMNAKEFFMEVPEVAKYFVKNGNQVTIEPHTEDLRDVLLYFKSNCMAAVLFQRGKIPFHVSGVVDNDGGVWLFSADSGTGKSTTALKLKERGYSIFTDDTALIYVENGQCFARASYPMIKAWPKTMENQKLYGYDQSFQIHSSHDKQGVFFHNDFIHKPLPVKGLVFLEIADEDIEIKKITGMEGISRLLPNVYRGQWVTALNQNALQFVTITEIAKAVPCFTAQRPMTKPSFEEFADALVAKIIQPTNNQEEVQRVS
jgi:hypothetical protein